MSRMSASAPRRHGITMSGGEEAQDGAADSRGGDIISVVVSAGGGAGHARRSVQGYQPLIAAADDALETGNAPTPVSSKNLPLIVRGERARTGFLVLTVCERSCALVCSEGRWGHIA